MKQNFVLRDTDIFPDPEFAVSEIYSKRQTVKAIAVRSDGRYGFVTNPVHKCVLLPGGGAESSNLEQEVIRECAEELGCTVRVLRKIAIAEEYRNRDKNQYETTCFLVEVTHKNEEDTRTNEEKENELTAIWLTAAEATKKLSSQEQRVRRGDLAFYNTAFNVIRDYKFWLMYLGKR
ncbi:MAG: NUDIX domain-containing protein [Candidatus Nomurabacteria bacterium]|nr:MAG: NUDIX domain-containing protein [Candidatus Nomurabacteria bacterium]